MPHESAWGIDSRQSQAAEVVVILLIALADTFTSANVAILYGVPLVVASRQLRRPITWPLLLTLSLLTFLSPLLGTLLPLPPKLGLSGYQLVNRGFVVIGLCLLVWLLNRRYYESVLTAANDDDPDVPVDFAQLAQVAHLSQRDAFDELLATVRPLVALLTASLAVAAIAAVDFATPKYFNPAILYAVPLLVLGWTERPRLVWGMTVAMIGLVCLGYMIGPSGSQHPDVRRIIVNRVLVTIVLIVIAYRLQRSASRPRGQLSSEKGACTGGAQHLFVG